MSCYCYQVCLSVSPLSQPEGLRVRGAEDQDVEGHRAEDGEDDEDSQQDALFVALLTRADHLLHIVTV